MNNKHCMDIMAFINHHCIIVLLLAVLCGTSLSIEVIVTVPDHLAGTRGETVVLPCSFVVNPHVVPLREYDMRWINETRRSAPSNLYIYSSARVFDSAVNVPDERRYRRINQDLHIEGFSDGDTGHYCCEITLMENYTIWSHKKCVTVTCVEAQFLGNLFGSLARFTVFVVVIGVVIAMACLLPGLVVFLAGTLMIGLQVGREIHKAVDITHDDHKRRKSENCDVYIEISPNKKKVKEEGLCLTEPFYNGGSHFHEGPSYHPNVLVDDVYDYPRGKRIHNGHGPSQDEAVIKHDDHTEEEDEDLQYIQFDLDDKGQKGQEEESDYEPFAIVREKEHIVDIDNHEKGSPKSKDEVVCVIESEDKRSLHSQGNPVQCAQSPSDEDIRHIHQEHIETIEVHRDAVVDEGIGNEEVDDSNNRQETEEEAEDIADFPPPPPAMDDLLQDRNEEYLARIDEENQVIDIEEPDQSLLQGQEEDVANYPPPPLEDNTKDKHNDQQSDPEDNMLLEAQNEPVTFPPPPAENTINHEQDNLHSQSNDAEEDDAEASDPEDERGHPGFAQALLEAYDKKQHEQDHNDSTVQQQNDEDTVESPSNGDDGASNGASMSDDAKTVAQEPDLLIDHRPTQSLYETTID